jgi:hypothetical protein
LNSPAPSEESSSSACLCSSITAAQLSHSQQRGFDKVQFDDLVAEATDLRRAVKRIAEDYDVKWRLNDEEVWSAFSLKMLADLGQGEHKHVESELDRREKAEDRHKRKKGEKDDD